MPPELRLLVDLIGTYSNHRNRADMLKRTRRWLSEGRQGMLQDPKTSVRSSSKAIVPRRVVDRLGEETVRELVEAQRAGAKLRELVERYEVSESSLKRLLRRAVNTDEDMCSRRGGRTPYALMGTSAFAGAEISGEPERHASLLRVDAVRAVAARGTSRFSFEPISSTALASADVAAPENGLTYPDLWYCGDRIG